MNWNQILNWTCKMASSACSSVDFDDVKRGGQYCVAGPANSVCCQNGQYTQGISIYEFPKNMKNRKRHNAWVKFVQRHRPWWRPTLFSIPCSNHFEESCFTKIALYYNLECVCRWGVMLSKQLRKSRSWCRKFCADQIFRPKTKRQKYSKNRLGFFIRHEISWSFFY